MWTTLRDASTGKERSFFLRDPFAPQRRVEVCVGDNYRGMSPDSAISRAYRVHYNRSRYGHDWQLVTLRSKGAALAEIKKLRRKGYREFKEVEVITSGKVLVAPAT